MKLDIGREINARGAWKYTDIDVVACLRTMSSMIVIAHSDQPSIGVASYGALGHVPPVDLQQLNFLVHFDLYKV